MEDVQQSISNVRNELDQVKNSNIYQANLMQRVQLSETLKEIVSGEPQSFADSTAIQELKKKLDRKAALTTEALALRQEQLKKTKQLNTLQAKNLEYVVTNRQLQNDITKLQSRDDADSEKFANHEDVIRQKKKLEKVTTCLALYRNSLQSLICASHADLTNDEDLQQTLLEMGMPLSDKLHLLTHS